MTTEPKRTNLFHYRASDLAIDGGKILPTDEQGPLDTDEDASSPLYDERLRSTKLTPEFISTITAPGIIDTPITVRKIKGVPFVVVGRKRVRTVRWIEAHREELVKAGTLPADFEILIPAIPADSGDHLELMEKLIRENQGRENDTFEVIVAKLKRYIAAVKEETGEDCTPERAASMFNMKPQQIKAWLKFDATALDAVKAAVYADKLSVSAGMEIARNAKTPEAQEKALAAAVAAAGANGKTSTQAARAAAKKIVRPDQNLGVTDRRTQRQLLQTLQDTAHALPKNTSEKMYAWYQGAEDMLELILGEQTADKRLVDMLERVREAMSKKGAA